jgi:hypothetical protein
VLYSCTSGGNTSNNINNGTLNYPCVLDLLSGNGITFKNYNFHCPANYSIHAGMNMIKSIITAVQAPKAWASPPMGTGATFMTAGIFVDGQ